MKRKILTLLLCVTILLCACNTINPNNDNSFDSISQSEEHSGTVSEDTSDENSDDKVSVQDYTLPEGFIFPDTDGSTSTTNLDKAIRNAILGGEQTVAHTKTYTSFYNLLNGGCEMIFTTPLSEEQLQQMANVGFDHEAEPVAGEGFVFVVNKDNPVETLTIEQIKGIYSGEITNWSEVGGNDAEIIAYQRNSDSGSQNYMISFMGDTPLMPPITDQIPATMSGILDVIANYDNGIDAIGYSVYAYSDGMYENISEIKYIKVNGVEPSFTTLADGSYPLLGYNYAVFSADEPEDSNVRALVKWIQSDKGQQVVANAGYIPYRYVKGLTLPEFSTKKLYSGLGTSADTQQETAADFYYQCNFVPESFTTAGLDEKIRNFITEATDELSVISEEEMNEFVKSRDFYSDVPKLVTRKELINGYLSVVVGYVYSFGVLDAPDYYYDVRTAVFDIYTGEQLELSDLFFNGVEFVPLLSAHLAKEAVMPYSSYGNTHDMLSDFMGLYEGEFEFTADSIIFRPGNCFADGVTLSIDELYEYMATSIPRDMNGCIDEGIPVYKKLRQYYSGTIGYAEEKNDITIWHLDKEKVSLSGDVCDKVNSFIDKTYETYFAPDKLLAIVHNNGINAESVLVGPWADFHVSLIVNRYIFINGANLIYVQSNDEFYYYTVIEGHNDSDYFNYFFDAQTGEKLKVGDLFKEGWESQAGYFVYDEAFEKWDDSTWTEYTEPFDVSTCRILAIEHYTETPYIYGDLRDLAWPAMIIVATENGDSVVVSVPREYIK